MARKQQHEEHENHERWLVSYADFITLLFAFFVVLFASSQADKGKAKAISDAVTEAFEGDNKALKKLAEILGGAVDEKGRGNAGMRGPGGSNKTGPAFKSAEFDSSIQALKKDLKEDLEKGRVRIALERRGLVISLQQAAFFPPGADTLGDAAFVPLSKIAKILKEMENEIRLEGHTDALPISNERFRSNWDLSAARGASILLWMSRVHGIDTGRMAVVAYADTAPVAENTTEEGRMRNRRVDITLLTHNSSLKETPEAKVAQAAQASHTQKESSH